MKNSKIKLAVASVIALGLAGCNSTPPTNEVEHVAYAIDKAPKRMLKPRKMKVYAFGRPSYTMNTYAWRPQDARPRITSIHTSAVPQTIRHFLAVVMTELCESSTSILVRVAPR